MTLRNLLPLRLWSLYERGRFEKFAVLEAKTFWSQWLLKR